MREIRIPTITRFAKLRPRLSVPKINLSPFGTDWSEYTSLGSVLPENLQYYPYQVVIPALALVFISLAFILLGDGLRDAFDPKSNKEN